MSESQDRKPVRDQAEAQGDALGDDLPDTRSHRGDGGLDLPLVVVGRQHAEFVFAQAAVGCSALAFSEFDWWFRGSAEPIPRVLELSERMRPAGALEEGTEVALVDGSGEPVATMILRERVVVCKPSRSRSTGSQQVDGTLLATWNVSLS